MSYSKGSAAGVVLLVTIIEDAGLIAWLVLARASIAENPNFTGRVFAQIFGFSLLEVVNWSVWLILLSNTSSLLSMSSLLASLYFFVGFYIEHQITENVITQQPYLRFRNRRGAITGGVVLETLSEGVGARLWVLYGPIGPVFLVVGSLVEHAIQYVVGRIPTEGPVDQLTTRN